MTESIGIWPARSYRALMACDHQILPSAGAGPLAGAGLDRRALASLGAELVEALDSDQLEIWYQPQFACKSGAMVGAEALARWAHPKRGLIAPDALFSAAQQCDNFLPLSRRLLARAFALAAQWREPVRVAVNIAPQQLAEPGFADEALDLARVNGLDPARVMLEITEDALLDDLERASRVLAQLRLSGFAIALDDFGAGFCNFDYLKRLPLDALKLDRSLIARIGHDRRDRAIFRAMVMLGKALSLEVIAEGVESKEQRLAAAREDCDLWQGFLGGKPMPPAQFAALLTV